MVEWDSDVVHFLPEKSLLDGNLFQWQSRHMDGRRILARYIRAHTTQAQFARDVECSQTHLTLVLQGKRGVSVPLAKRMSAATGGTVPVSALVSPEVADLMAGAAA